MSTTDDGRRSIWDVALGVVLVLLGLVVLANAALATILSVLFLGWVAVIGGIVLLVQGIVRRKSGSYWSMTLGGAVLFVLGVFVRNPAIGLVSLTLLAGALFLVAGVTRIAVSSGVPDGRWVLVTSGVVSIVLGLVVLANLMTASLLLLGIVVGVQTLIEGLTVLVAGRRPVSVSSPQATGAPA